MDRVGHIDAIKNGGGVIFREDFLEYTEGTEASDGGDLEVFRTDIGINILKRFKVGATDAFEICRFHKKELISWLSMARHSNYLQRALCIIDIGNFYGWDTIDEDPLRLNAEELKQRWYKTFKHEGSVTARGCFKPGVIVPQMALTLHKLHSETFEQLFKKPFPLVPSGPFLNPRHPWWNSHGAQAVNKLVETLKELAPSEYEFGVRNETFGYWRK